MSSLRHFITTAAILAAVTGWATGTDSVARFDFMPEISGALRARYEIQTHNGMNKFSLRNARVKLAGKIMPIIDYYLQADLCNNGKMVFLDGWGRFRLPFGLDVKAGQFRVPFGVDPHRGPGNYIFANRSFIGRDICNLRLAGLSLTYTIPHTGLKLETGVFNTTSISDYNTWTHDKTFAVKATLSAGDFNISGGYLTQKPDDVRLNMADAGITFTRGRWLAEAEYMLKHYDGDSFKNCHAYNAFVNYTMPLRKCLFNAISVQARADGSTAHSTGISHDDGLLHADFPYRNRVTIGTTASYIYKHLRCDIRLNYENYFYHSDYTVTDDRNDRVVAELVIVF